MFRPIAMFLTVVLLVMTLLGSYYFAYTGMGVANASPGSARQGSIFGLDILGGGPGSGK